MYDSNTGERKPDELLAAGFERVSADDREWFEKHPKKNRRRRPMAPEEAGLVPAPDGMVCTGGVMEVRQLMPGIRFRRVVRARFEPRGAVQ